MLAFLSNEGTSGRNVEWFGVVIANINMFMLLPSLLVVLGQRSSIGRPGAAEDPTLLLSVFYTKGLARFLEHWEVVWRD